MRTWTEHCDEPHDDLREPTEAAHRTEPAAGHLNQAVNDDPAVTSDSAGITPTSSPVPHPEVAPGPPQVDRHLGEALYRQAASRDGFTPDSAAAGQVTIEQAATRQSTSNADRLHALADQVETMAASRGPAPARSAAVRPAPAAPPPKVQAARARAVSAQIWDDTRDEYDPPAQTQRR